MHRVVALTISFILAGCSEVDQGSDQDLSESSFKNHIVGDSIGYNVDTSDYIFGSRLADYIVNLPDSTIDIQTIHTTCAILIYPLEEQISQLKKQDKNTYDAVVDDNTYYMGTAIGLLDSLGVKSVLAKGRYMKLGGSNGFNRLLDLRKEGLPFWNLIFFKEGKEPSIISAPTLQLIDVKNYFEIK